jgi:hypothetical protein
MARKQAGDVDPLSGLGIGQDSYVKDSLRAKFIIFYQNI